MGKRTGYDVYNNNQESGRLQQSDWASTKASAGRAVRRAHDAILNLSVRDNRPPLLVVAVDPDTGEVVAGKLEV